MIPFISFVHKNPSPNVCDVLILGPPLPPSYSPEEWTFPRDEFRQKVGPSPSLIVSRHRNYTLFVFSRSLGHLLRPYTSQLLVYRLGLGGTVSVSDNTLSELSWLECRSFIWRRSSFVFESFLKIYKSKSFYILGITRCKLIFNNPCIFYSFDGYWSFFIEVSLSGSLLPKSLFRFWNVVGNTWQVTKFTFPYEPWRVKVNPMNSQTIT